MRDISAVQAAAQVNIAIMQAFVRMREVMMLFNLFRLAHSVLS
jgi:hypothetical protein